MKIKKIIGLLIAAAIIMSTCVISVSASGLTSENYSTEAGGTKGNQNSGAWSRVHTGSNDASRETATETVKSGYTVTSDTGIINAYNFTSTTTSGAKFVHSTFKFNSTGGFSIRIRIGSETDSGCILTGIPAL